MTILNQATEGLYPEAIVLARALVVEGSMPEDDLIRICSAGNALRLRGSLSRWTTLGLFKDTERGVALAQEFAKRRGQSLDDWTDQLQTVFRKLLFSTGNCLPLFGENEGVSSDFVRALSWLLAQDIFAFPTTYNGDSGVEGLQRKQLNGVRVIQNDTRWPSLRAWARYLGFSTGEGARFLVDPTAAVRSELPHLFRDGTSMAADRFVAELADTLPVLDSGKYRLEVENRLDQVTWQQPPSKHLSMSLSFALRRLQLDQAIVLESRADAEQGYVLTGKDYRSAETFTHVRHLARTS